MALPLTSTAALILLPFVLPICIWVAWSDLRTMKIPNKAVMALLAVWLVIGFFVVPLNAWLWGWALGAITLVIGFVLHLIMGIGAGDVKFAAAMAPFFVHSDIRFNMGLIAACMLGSLAAHRLMRALPAMRRATPDWASWTSGKYFPFGLALTGMLIFHLLVAVRA